MCALQRVIKYFSAFEWVMAVGARRTGWSVSSTATSLGFSRLTVACAYQEWSTTQTTSSQLDTSLENIGQHGPESLWKMFDTL